MITTNIWEIKGSASDPELNERFSVSGNYVCESITQALHLFHEDVVNIRGFEREEVDSATRIIYGVKY